MSEAILIEEKELPEPQLQEVMRKREESKELVRAGDLVAACNCLGSAMSIFTTFLTSDNEAPAANIFQRLGFSTKNQDKVYEEVMKLHDQRFVTYPMLLQIMREKAMIHLDLDDYNQAEVMFVEIHRIFANVLPPLDIRVIRADIDVGFFTIRNGFVAKGEQILLNCIQNLHEIKQEESLDCKQALSHLCMVYVHGEKWKEVLELSTKAFHISKLHLGESHHDTRQARLNMARMADRLDMLEEAAEYYADTLRMTKEHLHDRNRDHEIVDLNRTLGELLSAMTKWDAALVCFEEAAEVLRKNVNEDHPAMLDMMLNITVMHDSLGQHDLAMQEYHTLYDKFVAVCGENDENCIKIQRYIESLKEMMSESGDN